MVAGETEEGEEYTCMDAQVYASMEEQNCEMVRSMHSKECCEQGDRNFLNYIFKKPHHQKNCLAKLCISSDVPRNSGEGRGCKFETLMESTQKYMPRFEVIRFRHIFFVERSSISQSNEDKCSPPTRTK